MDYEKGYKDALERAKKIHDNRNASNSRKEWIESIFPELAESEDERIRKALVNEFEHIGNYDWHGIERTKILAWIEKQKEQKPVECADDVVEEAEEYASKVACGEYGVEVTEAYIAGVLSERNRGTGWSEFDKGVLEDAICATDTLGNDESFNKSNPNLAKAFRVAKDWLKSLPERLNLQ